MKRKWPADLDQISRIIGESSDLVQGPGGNTSWKNGDDIWVKASGAQLRDAELTPIFCRVNRSDPYVNLEDNHLRPSIESSLHVSIPATYVLHVHSIGAVSLAIRDGVDSKSRSLYEEFQLGHIPYLRPGKELASGIESHLDPKKALDGFILQNHGIVVWGEDLAKIYDLLLNFEARVTTMFPVIEENLQECMKSGLNNYLAGNYVTPDHAVFSKELDNPSLSGNPKWIGDLHDALCKSISLIDDKASLKYLSSEEALGLQNWEAEKFRRKQNI